MRTLKSFFFIFLAIFLIAGCSGGGGSGAPFDPAPTSPTGSSTPSPTVSPTITPTLSPTVSPTPTITPTPSPTVSPIPTPHRIQISPENPTIISGEMVQFLAKVYDQYGQEMSGVKFFWVNADQNGLFTQTNVGDWLVSVSTANNVSADTTVTVNEAPVPGAIVSVRTIDQNGQTIATSGTVELRRDGAGIVMTSSLKDGLATFKGIIIPGNYRIRVIAIGLLVYKSPHPTGWHVLAGTDGEVWQADAPYIGVLGEPGTD